jgi:hypothetical protein
MRTVLPEPPVGAAAAEPESALFTAAAAEDEEAFLTGREALAGLADALFLVAIASGNN